jgi:arginyl-tRNA--protein-N-Asp/Glu arginylyltransferase
MITRRFEPDSLSRAELDDYLALGWYRIGRALITTDYLASDGELRSTIWTRLDLQRHRWRSSLRKLMARNGRRFQIKIGALVLDPAHERLYARYREMAGGDRARSLDDVLGGEAGRLLFDTREISIWSDDALVAFSWFDLGETSVQSLIGVYDPEYRKHGLGFYTLLLEIAHASALGMRFHYAGYVLSEPSGMDYKRRVGQLEYLDPATKGWLRELPYAPLQSPAEIQRRRLGEAADALSRSGSSALRVLNSALLIPGLSDQVPRCATEPILLICASPEHSWGVLTVWEQERERYAIFSGRPVSVALDRDDADDADDATTEPVQIDLFILHERLGDYSSVEEVAFWVRHYLPLIAPPLAE